MPRGGGESGKLGDRYEAVWTVDSLLDVLCGEAISLNVEPFDPKESLGIEFKKETLSSVEFHSAKRQTSGLLWSLAELTRLEKNGRSIFDDLNEKLSSAAVNEVVFVSGTTAKDLEELWQAAKTSRDASAFKARVETMSVRLQNDFEDRLLRPRFNNEITLAYDCLRRIRVVGLTESEMIRRVDQRIRGMLYRIDGAPLDAQAIRLLLADTILDRFGQSIRQDDVREFLSKHGVAERDWSRPSGPREIVEKRNALYVQHIEAELIDGARIPRMEAERAANALKAGKKRVALIGPAGLGKSCTVTQAVERLRNASIPCLAVRLDLQASALTSQGLGRELGFPESPALVLAGIANGARCVLVLDQLDAISLVSGRNQRLWEVFEELLLEAEKYSQMGILLACRSFDAEHDSRLRRLLADSEDTERVELGLLASETVRQSLQKAGVAPSALESIHLELLRTPLHLSLYLQGDPASHPRFRGVQELLGRYWTHKRARVAEQLGRESRWHDIIKRLVERLSGDQTLSAPSTVLDQFDEADVAAMASQNVIVLENDTVRFFHEAFFDYCWARLFVEEGRTLMEFLLADGAEQHLFRRAQVRQILEFQRERQFSQYLRDLRELLTDTRVRYHLRKLAVDWLAKRLDPRPEEWQLLESFDPTSAIGFLAKRIAWRNPPWVRLLGELGVWAKWFDSDQSEMRRLAAWMLGLPGVVDSCCALVAQLFRPYVTGEKPWREEFAQVFSFKERFLTREMFELLKDATKAGLLKAPSDHDWYHYKELAEAKPEWAVELLAVMLDVEGKKTDTDAPEERLQTDFVVEAAKRAAELFAKDVLPRVVNEVSGWNEDDPARWGARRLWQGIGSRFYDSTSALEIGLEVALEQLARDNPDALDAISGPAEVLSNNVLAPLLLKTWSNNGLHYADKIVTFLLSNPRHLGLGYFSWGTGVGTAAIARGAIKAASPHCSASNYFNLEAAILEFTTDDEREEPKRFGYHRMVLLECLSPDRLSKKASLHFEELKRKFPQASFEMPGSTLRGGFVGPPIPADATTHMTDDQWLRAMRRYTKERSPRSSEDFLKGGLHEFATLLRSEAQIAKARFAELALRMEETIPHEYFGAIVSGITSTQTEASDSAEVKARKTEIIPVAKAMPVILRAHAIAPEKLARDICWAIKSLVQQGVLPEMIPILAEYAMHHPDPEKEQWQESAGGGQKSWGGDPHFQGMNSVRGAAAEALAAMLFADKGVFREIEPAVLSVVKDRSIAVRSCAILCLVAMLNFDRDRAVKLFCELCDGANEVLGTHYAEQFIHYATHRHYSLLRPILLGMLKATDEKQVPIAARQITLASFHDPEAQKDLQLIFTGGAVCRKAAADIYAHNIGRPEPKSICVERLSDFFSDGDSEVRAAASDCFRNISPNQLSEEVDLIFRFIESPACIENSHQLIYALEKATEPLPEVICRIPERLIEEHRTAAAGESFQARRWTYHLPALVVRLYQQSQDRDIKRRCLNIIDGMLELGVDEIEKELSQVER